MVDSDRPFQIPNQHFCRYSRESICAHRKIKFFTGGRGYIDPTQPLVIFGHLPNEGNEKRQDKLKDVTLLHVEICVIHYPTFTTICNEELLDDVVSCHQISAQTILIDVISQVIIDHMRQNKNILCLKFSCFL